MLLARCEDHVPPCRSCLAIEFGQITKIFPGIFKILFRRAWDSSVGARSSFVRSSFEMAKRTPRQNIVWTLYGLKPPMGYRIDAAGSVAYTEDSSCRVSAHLFGLS